MSDWAPWSSTIRRNSAGDSTWSWLWPTGRVATGGSRSPPRPSGRERNASLTPPTRKPLVNRRKAWEVETHTQHLGIFRGCQDEHRIEEVPSAKTLPAERIGHAGA